MAQKERLVSGMRPTGRLHLGNYWGALHNWISLQDKYDCLFFIADWHALTTGHEDTSSLESNCREMLADWLAAGLDPAKCVIFRQSRIMEHAELSLLLGMITPLGWLLRNPAYKEVLVELHKKRYAGQEQSAQRGADGKLMHAIAGVTGSASEAEIAAMQEFSSLGFLGYPVLMATDIVIHDGAVVPVGQDQVVHIEITRDIVRRFSELYGQGILREPKPLLSQVPKVPGIDGRKMSKSYGNAIELGEDEASAQAKIMRMFTDPKKLRANDKGDPDGCVVFSFHKIYNPDAQTRAAECRAGSTGCVQCKKHLASLLLPELAKFRERRAAYEKDPSLLDRVLEEGNRKALESARAKLSRVRAAMRIG